MAWRPDLARRSFVFVAVAASMAAWAAMMAWVIMLGGHHRKFMVIMTVVMPFACLLGLNTAYLLLQRLFRLRLSWFLASGAGLGLAAYIVRGNQWNWHPVFSQSAATAALLIGFPIVGLATYWVMLRWLAPELAD